jgi:hypothetical protein
MQLVSKGQPGALRFINRSTLSEIYDQSCLGSKSLLRVSTWELHAYREAVIVGCAVVLLISVQELDNITVPKKHA